jgi:hypothetical protein
MDDKKDEIPPVISGQSTLVQVAQGIPPVITESESNLDVQATIADRIQSAANEYTNKIFRYMLFVVGGALIATVWNLNGQISQAVGSSGVATKSLEIEVSRLNEEIKKLEQQIKQRDCLDNKRVIDKAGCYRGN